MLVHVAEGLNSLTQPTASSIHLRSKPAMFVVAVSRTARGATAVGTTVHPAPSPSGDRRRLAWRARSSTGPTLAGLGQGSCFGGTHGVVRQFWSPPRLWPPPRTIPTTPWAPG